MANAARARAAADHDDGRGGPAGRPALALLAAVALVTRDLPAPIGRVSAADGRDDGMDRRGIRHLLFHDVGSV